MSTKFCSDERKTAIQKKLIDWFKRNKRDLPWRHERDPYRVWVSEIMLQQTQVDTVIPYFQRFMDKFPTLHDLAAASEEEVIKAWEGLGYYSRARHLHHAVREVSEVYRGQVPDNLEDISRLKGIGPYTAGAILSLAYGKAEPAVDGNVMRVMTRLFALDDDVSKAQTRVKIERLVRTIIPEKEPGAFNEGLMELGALICTPRNPACLHCPLLNECIGRKKGIHEHLPVKKRYRRTRAVSLTCGIIMDEHYVLLHKRPGRGLLAGMWQFPNSEGADPSVLLPELNIAWDTHALGTVTHMFSHLQWKLDVYKGKATRKTGALPRSYRWVELETLSDYALPQAFHKVRALAGI